MSYIEKKNRNQISFLPPTVEEYISKDNPVRVIDAFVDTLDLGALGFGKAQPASTGRPAYDPSDLLKLYIYGYMNRIRSSRRLMAECRRNIELFYLLGDLSPDFRTIADFRKDNASAIKNVFCEFVRLCSKAGLYQKRLVAIDGTKVRACNADDKAYNRDILEKKIANINTHIDAYMKELDGNDLDEAGHDDEDRHADVGTLVDELRARKEKYEGYLARLDETGQTQILETDPEAHRMHTHDGFHCCYNVQTATDTGSHLIAGFEVTDKTNDMGSLTPTAEIAKKNLGMETVAVVADKGYDTQKDILGSILRGTIPYVGMKYDKGERIFTIDHRPAHITERDRASTDPADIEKCICAGVLPACLECGALSIETQNIAGVGCFERVDERHVVCPMGMILTKIKRRNEKQTIFRSRSACRGCKCRCTPSANPKEVSFIDGERYVPVRMYGDMKMVKNPLPPDAVIHPNSRVLSQKMPGGKVIIHVRCGKEKMDERMCTAEHPFGSVKRWGESGYLLCKGKRKATAEIALAFLAYNIKRAVNMIGNRRLETILGGV